MRISIFGLGYVGAVSCGCLAEMGHEIIGVDVAEAKVDLINSGRTPIIEEKIGDIIAKQVQSGRLTATSDVNHAIQNSDLAFLCVGTPSTASGGVNAVYLEGVCQQIGKAIAARGTDDTHFAVLNRSTCLPPIHQRLIEILAKESGDESGGRVGYVCHPEFLREGAAVDDFYNPPKIVFGASDDRSYSLCEQLYPGIEAETYRVPVEVAAMIKYADNCYHAVKVTFGNEIGMLCNKFGIDSHAVMEIFCKDLKLNISPRYLKPGSAFGGSCLPKDLRGVLDAARDQAIALPMLSGMMKSNKVQIEQLLARLADTSKSPIGVIGLAFKEGTDDVRESPVVSIIESLTGKGHPVCVYDKYLSLQSLVGANRSFALESIPHLADLLRDDLQAVVDASPIVLISHRLSPEVWQSIQWGDGVRRVIDLVNIPELYSVPGYEGLYW